MNNIGNVRSSKGKILQRTNQLAIFSRHRQEMFIMDKECILAYIGVEHGLQLVIENFFVRTSVYFNWERCKLAGKKGALWLRK